MGKNIGRFIKDESGTTAIEYGLIAGLLSIAIVGTLVTMGNDLNTLYITISTGVSTAVAN